MTRYYTLFFAVQCSAAMSLRTRGRSPSWKQSHYRDYFAVLIDRCSAGDYDHLAALGSTYFGGGRR